MKQGFAEYLREDLMGRIVSVASQKGGVGKTTVALNLGYSLSRFDGPVLVVDTDPQGSMAIASNSKKRNSAGLIDVFRGRVEPREVVTSTRDGAMGVVGVGTLEENDIVHFEKTAANGDLAKVIRALSADFNYTIIDVPSGVGSIVTAVLGESDGVVMPVQSRSLALRTLPAFLKTIRWVRQGKNPDLRLSGILVTMYNRDNPSEVKAYEAISANFPEELFFNTIIPFDDVFEKASMTALPVALLPEGQELSHLFFQLAMELLDQQSTEETDGDVAGLF